jgi:hypothetical protein
MGSSQKRRVDNVETIPTGRVDSAVHLTVLSQVQWRADHRGIYTYGVEFLDADAAKRKFWGIYFP